MFQKVFEYAGPHKKGLYAATAVVLVSVLMGVLPFVLAYQVIAPLVMGETIDASFIILRVVLVLVCLAVSYTHLDVYKRQARQGLQRQMTQKAAQKAVKTASRGTVILRQAAQAAAKAVASLVSALAGLVGGGVLLILSLIHI